MRHYKRAALRHVIFTLDAQCPWHTNTASVYFKYERLKSPEQNKSV